MKIASLAHFSAPFRMAGSEVVLHELMKAAALSGHEVRSWSTHKNAQATWRGNEPDVTFDGVLLHRVRNPLVAVPVLQKWLPDVIVTHHQHSTYVIKWARKMGIRSVYLTHNQMPEVNQRQIRLRPDLVIHNSEWVQADLESKFGPSKATMVFHPPLTPDRHLVESTGDCFTLINLNEHKGSLQFYELAERMPDRKFLGVEGGHGPQVIRRHLPNVEILDHDPDMKRVWSRTRTLLMPSIYESYGLTAIEAALNGIPTIANPTPGLKENLGRDGLFADRDDLVSWERAIKRLDNPDTYADASTYALGRAEKALTATRRSLSQWVEWIQG